MIGRLIAWLRAFRVGRPAPTVKDGHMDYLVAKVEHAIENPPNVKLSPQDDAFYKWKDSVAVRFAAMKERERLAREAAV